LGCTVVGGAPTKTHIVIIVIIRNWEAFQALNKQPGEPKVAEGSAHVLVKVGANEGNYPTIPRGTSAVVLGRNVGVVVDSVALRGVGVGSWRGGGGG